MLTEQQRRVLVAATERVLPSGAAEADVVAYADWMAGEGCFQPAVRRLATGLDLLDSLAGTLWNRGFAACLPAEQDAVLERVQGTPHPTMQRFFATLVTVTLSGFLCPPGYGGNRGGRGWRYIGFAPRPPTSGAEERGG